jgi:hypothetical protein
LYEAGAAKMGTEEDVFVEIFTGHTQAQMKEIATIYDAKFNASLESAVSSEFSGKVCVALLALLLDPVDFFCRNIKDAMVGAGTDEATINRTIGGQDKSTAAEIAARWTAKYDSDLCKELEKEISGDYLKAVQTYLTAPDPTGGIEARRLHEARQAEDEQNAELHAAEYAAAVAAANVQILADIEAAKINAEAEAVAIEEQRRRDEERAACERQRREEYRAAEMEAERARAARRQLEHEQAERARQERERAMEMQYEAMRAQRSMAGGSNSSSSSSSDSSSDDDGASPDVKRARRQARKAARKAAGGAKKSAKKMNKAMKKMGKKGKH